MEWFLFAVANAFLSSITWLTLKKAQDKGVTHEDALSIFFVFLILALLGWHAFTGTSLVFPPLVWTGVLVLAALFAATGNWFLLHSFQHSANPGVSVALFATQTVWVGLFGMLFFGAAIHWLAGAGVLLVIFGVALIHVKKVTSSFKWGLLALLAALTSAFYWVGVMMAQRHVAGLLPTVILLLVVIPQIPFFFIIKRCRKEKKKKWSEGVVRLLGFGGVIGALSNLAAIVAVTSAPNPGYALAINAANVVITLIASRLLFKSALHWRHALATLVIVAGVVAIRLGSS